MSGEKAITNQDQVKTEENIKKCTLGLIEKFESPVSQYTKSRCQSQIYLMSENLLNFLFFFLKIPAYV